MKPYLSTEICGWIPLLEILLTLLSTHDKQPQASQPKHLKPHRRAWHPDILASTYYFTPSTPQHPPPWYSLCAFCDTGGSRESSHGPQALQAHLVTFPTTICKRFHLSQQLGLTDSGPGNIASGSLKSSPQPTPPAPPARLLRHLCATWQHLVCAQHHCRTPSCERGSTRSTANRGQVGSTATSTAGMPCV